MERIKADSDRDFWMSPDEAERYGLVDRVQQPRKTLPAVVGQ